MKKGVFEDMSTVFVTHELYENGMALLREHADVIVMNSDKISEFKGIEKADGIIIRIGKIDRELIKRCPNLKVITRPGVGVDAIDVKAATEKGIPVVVSPGANARSVAEHTLAMTYAITKNLMESYIEAKAGNFFIRNKYASVELIGRTVGVVGYGNVGKKTAELFHANGLKVCVYDPFVSRQAVEEKGFTYYKDLFDMLPFCDIVTLHIPATPETRKIIGADAIRLMKEGAFLINNARGDLVNEDALYDALSTGKLAGAAVDLMEKEPIDINNRLLSLSNFIVSPHMASLTKECASKLAQMAVEGTLAVIRGEKWPDVFNKEAYLHDRWK